MSAIADASAQKRDSIEAAGLRALNIAREAFDDAGFDVSTPGAAEAGEFYASIDGVDIAVKIEIL